MRFIISFLLVMASVVVYAQPQPQYSMSKDTLIARRKAIMEAINETEKQLAAIKNDKQATMGQLRALQNKLADRQKLISNINYELNSIDKDIKVSAREVMTLKQKLEQLKIRYAQSVRYAYTSRSSYDMLAFLFSSNDFNDAMRRMKYLKKFRDFRKYQVEQIHLTQNQLQQKIGTLNAVKEQKDKLLNTQVQQKQVLLEETNQTNQVVMDLKSKESKLVADIEKNRKITTRINKAINDLIEREMAKASKAAAEAAAKKTGTMEVKPGTKTNIKSSSTDNNIAVNNVPKSNTPKTRSEVELLLTPEDVVLAGNFEGNKGRMYWPVEKGYITEHFGVHPHPLAPKVQVECPGVGIQTDENAKIRCVFNGTVTNIFSVAGGNSQIVMIKHGNYFTVYNGLSSVAVKKGDEVNAKQPIGTVSINDEGVPVIYFQIWKSDGKKGNVKMNPEQWIGRAQ